MLTRLPIIIPTYEISETPWESEYVVVKTCVNPEPEFGLTETAEMDCADSGIATPVAANSVTSSKIIVRHEESKEFEKDKFISSNPSRTAEKATAPNLFVASGRQLSPGMS